MRDIDTDALQLVSPTLGIGNPATATRPATFDDENVQQVLEIGELVRRARVAGANAGIGAIRVALTQAGAGTNSEVVVPWTDTASVAMPQEEIRDGKLDLWLLYLSGERTAGAGDLNSWRLSLNLVVGGIPFIQDGGGTQASRITLASGAALAAGGLIADGLSRTFIPLGIRMPRTPAVPPATTLRFEMDTTAAADIGFVMGIAWFPAGLGQDALAQ